jgi:signal transduction histidine kinase
MDDRRTGEDAPGVGHQEGEKVELFRREVHVGGRDAHRARRAVEPEPTEILDLAGPVLLAAGKLGAAQHGRDAGQQLVEGEGLGDVVVGADLQPNHLVELTCLESTDEVVVRRWSTAERDLSVRARRISRPGPGVLVWVRDETRVRHLEKMRRDFISNVSHELRTPLAAMRLMTETLLAGALEDPPAAQEFVNRIGLEVEQMSQMVEELLELSALEGGQLPVPDESVPVVDLLIAIDRLRPLIDDKEINLVFDVPTDIPPIRGDVAHLQHVLRNLVHNAVKFTPPHGTITVSAAAVGDQVELRCADTGVGIRSDDLTRIFERFWKADSSRSRDGEGSGLGLAITRHVVAAHQGTIRAESEFGHGATFVVTLPACVTAGSPVC